jgi:hypothetical protein
MEIKKLLVKMNEQSKDISIPDFSENYQEQAKIVTITPAIQKQEQVTVYVATANYDIFEKRL